VLADVHEGESGDLPELGEVPIDDPQVLGGAAEPVPPLLEHVLVALHRLADVVGHLGEERRERLGRGQEVLAQARGEVLNLAPERADPVRERVARALEVPAGVGFIPFMISDARAWTFVPSVRFLVVRAIPRRSASLPTAASFRSTPKRRIGSLSPTRPARIAMSASSSPTL
jgi:hypothetical protein